MASKKSRDSTVITNGNHSSASPTQLEQRYAEAQSRLSPRRRQMMRSILNNPEELYFLSSRELGKRFGLDAATIVRTIQVLGYERFADFASDLRRHFVTRITPYTVMQAAAREKQTVADRMRRNVDKEIETLHKLKNNLDTAQILELARLIHRARRIVVVGVDLAASLSYLLAYGLAAMGFDAEAPIGSSGNLLHKVKIIDAKDLLIAISFGRCLRESVEAVQRAHRQGAITFGITDSDTTPIAKYSDNYLIAPVASPVFTGSYIAPVAVINAIIEACAHLNPKRTLKVLHEYEKEFTSGTRWYVDY
jgi:DNA-binding MurR/RpiR family transcriptional regulator